MSTKYRSIPGTSIVVSEDQYEKTAAHWRARAGAGWAFDMKYRVKDLFENTAGAGDVTAVPPISAPTYGVELVAPPSRPLRVQELFHAETTSSPIIRVVRADESSDGSGPSAEGVEYGEVVETVEPHDYVLSSSTARMVTSEDFLSDVPSAMSYLTKRGTYLVQRAEEKKLIYGSGTGEALGLIHAHDANEAAVTRSQGTDPIDEAVARLMVDVFNASGLLPSWVLMNPLRWLEQATAASTGFASRDQMFQLWGMKIAMSSAISHDTVIIGNENAAGRWVHTSGVRVEQSSGFQDFFAKGKVLVRAKIRSTLAYEFPSGIGVLTMGS